MNADEEEERLKRDIAIQPINPKLLCKVWQLSNIGVREKVIGKFATSRSIQSASMGSWIDERSLLSTIDALQTRTANYYLRKKNRPFTSTLDMRYPTDTAVKGGFVGVTIGRHHHAHT